MPRAVPGGTLTSPRDRAAALRRSIAEIEALFRSGQPAGIVGTVSGSPAARDLWRRLLTEGQGALRAREVLSLWEDLPVNQAFGLLLLWQRLRPRLRPGEGALVAFVFGEGSRATPFTEAECGQKSAMASYVAVRDGDRRRWLTTVELALRAFAPVEACLRRSGFDGVVVKWGDEVLIPSRDLSGVEPLVDGADVVRFVSMRRLTEEDAASKDWIGVDGRGRITAFVPRRPLGQMEALAGRGVLQRQGDALIGGVNLGSIAVSRRLLDALLEAFAGEVNDPTADRRRRPDLDPQLFTALTVATIADPAERAEAWRRATEESPAICRLDGWMPGLVDRLREVLDRFAARHGRAPKLVALDLGAPWWGDIGQHGRIRETYAALNERGPPGEIARALAGIPSERDRHGNILAGDTVVADGVRVRGSVLLDARLEGEGEVVDSVLVGTRAGRIRARDAFDVLSAAVDLALEPGAGAYRVVAVDPVVGRAGERVTTLFTPSGPALLRCREDTDLRDRAATYDRPLPGNPMSFRDAHRVASTMDPQEVEALRERATEAVRRRIRDLWG